LDKIESKGQHKKTFYLAKKINILNIF